MKERKKITVKMTDRNNLEIDNRKKEIYWRNWRNKETTLAMTVDERKEI